MSALYVYRIEVTHWPTDDGQSWARFYGPKAAVPHNEVPDWLEARIEAAMPLRDRYRDTSDRGRVAARIRYDDDREQLIGVLMPKPKRRNYLSASGACELAADMRAFGADVTVQRSEQVRWSS